MIATEQATALVTPPLGGAIFAILGPLPALIVNAATYVGSQLSLAAIAGLGPDEPGPIPMPREIVRDVARGFSFLRGDPALRSFTLIGGGLNFFGLMAGAVLIPFLKRDFGASDLVVGYALGFGAYTIDGVAFIPVMLTHDLVVAVTFLAITNALVTFEIALIVGWRMRVIPEDLVGRVFGAVRLVVLAGTVPGSILGGWLADRFDARVPIEISTVGYLVCAVAVWLVPAIRRERR